MLIFISFFLLDLYFLEDSPELFHYLSQSGCLKDKSLNDKELFNSVMVSAAALLAEARATLLSLLLLRSRVWSPTLHFCLSRRPWRCYSSQRRKSGTCLSCCRGSFSWETLSSWLPEERRSPPSKVSSRVMGVWKCETEDKCGFSVFVWLSVVTNASELLGLDAFQLSEVLTQRSIILRGEEICSPLTIEQVRNTYIYSPSTF